MMNERIREVWIKAAIKDSDPDNWDAQEQFIERFAELIVFECVNAVMDGTKEGDHYAQRIEQHFDHSTDGVLHFGVEE
jgi:hypothetical protein